MEINSNKTKNQKVKSLNIQFLTSKKLYQNTIGVISPLIRWKDALRSKGFYVTIHYNLSSLNMSDLILIDSKFHRDLWELEFKKIKNDFLNLKIKCNKLIFFDTTDSTGCIQTEILKFVDVYWKMQILKNKNFYKEKLYGNRIFTNFYHNENKINDSNVLWSIPIEDDINLNKIKFAWNYGISDFSRYSNFKNYLFKSTHLGFFLNINKTLYNDKIGERKIDISGRFNIKYERETVQYSRLKLKKLLKSKIDTKKINKKQFYREIKQSKIIASPFGWGEICYRDFETFKHGGVLLKPDMDMIETWPNFYIKDKTYVSYSWDMKNVLEKIEYYLSNESMMQNIASEAQKNYQKYVYEDCACNLFVNHFSTLVENI